MPKKLQLVHNGILQYMSHANALEGQICPLCKRDYSHLGITEYSAMLKQKMCHVCYSKKQRAKERKKLVQGLIEYAKEKRG